MKCGDAHQGSNGVHLEMHFAGVIKWVWGFMAGYEQDGWEMHLETVMDQISRCT